MLLLVGLGNPGPQYVGNRHNIGFMVIEAIARRWSLSPFRRKFQGEIADGTVGGERVVVLKPLTYMNLSGQSVQAALAFHKVEPADVLVFHDDLDLAAGRLRVKRGGGHGGHNGLRSLQAHIGPEFRRVRLGIGHPGDRDRVVGHVLENFSKVELADWVTSMVDAVADNADRLVKGDDSGFTNRVALVLNPSKRRSQAPTSPPSSAVDGRPGEN